MSLTAGDLGSLGSLAKALGLVTTTGDLNGAWLSEPGTYLSRILADDGQRGALVAFVDEVLGGATSTTDPRGLTWLPVFERSGSGGPDVTVYVVLDDQPADHVRIGVGASVAASGQVASLRTHVPLFRAAKTGHPPASSPVVLGTADGSISLDVRVTVSDPLLQALELVADVPTGGDTPTIGLNLLGLRLPGDTGPHDLSLSVHDLAELEATVLQLVLTVVKAGVAAAGSGPLAALAGLLGLRDGSSVPALPVADLVSRGVPALTAWFEGMLRGDATRAAWLAELSDLFTPLGATADTEAVSFPLGPARVRLGVHVGTGTGGHPLLVPFVRAEVGTVAGDAIAAVEADLASIDLGATGSTRALVSCAARAVLGKRADGHGTALLTGDPAVDRLVFGFALDATRRPVLVLAAEHVTIGGQLHDVIDLSSPDAIAQAAGTVLSAVLDEVLAGLGPVLAAAKTLLGLTAPTGFPTVQTTNLAAFLHDPLGAVAAYWQGLLDTHADAVPVLLGVLRDLVADASQAAAPVTGTGTAADPWVVPVIDPVALHAWVGDGVLTLAVGARLVVDTLGQGCTRLTTRVSVALTAIDLAARHVTFVPEVTASLGAVAVTTNQALVDIGPLSVHADEIGLQATWRPAGGLSVGVNAPGLAVDTEGFSVPVTLPVVGAEGSVLLDAAGWDALEGLLGVLGAAAPVGLAGDLVRLLGWRLRGPGEIGGGVRLRLADLATNPAAALTTWIGALAVEEAPELVRLLRPLARSLTGGLGDAGALTGTGTPTDPWLVRLLSMPGSPGLATWVEPAGPGQLPVANPVPLAVNPDRPGLPSAGLVRTLRELAPGDPVVAALLTDRPRLAEGMDALVTRWAGSDGVVIPPPGSVDGADVPGIAMTFLDDRLGTELADALDLEDVLGRVSTTTVRVSVGTVPWLDGAPAERVVHLDTPGLPPEGFTLPGAATGDWYVVLGSRAACRLPSDDPDGVGGQAARLARFLTALGPADPAIAVVASAEAGHAAARAAGTADAVTDVVTLGTPWSEVTLSVIDVAPAAEAVRALAALDAAGAATGTARLARARALLGGLVAQLGSDDPVRELRLPATAAPAPHAGLTVHAVFGLLSQALVQTLLTDLVLAAVGARRALVTSAPEEPTAARTGVVVPLAIGRATGISLSGAVTVELGGVGQTSSTIGLLADRAVRLHLEIRRPGGWLVGGPDPGRAPGSQYDVDLRWVEADVTVPVQGGPGRADARVVLHEPRVFGQTRPRWVVRTAASTSGDPANDETTPALPEVRVLLSALSAALTQASTTDPALPPVVDALRALGVVDAVGGSVPDALDHLLHDPVAFSASLLADPTRRGSLATALRGLVSGGGTGETVTWTVGGATISADLGGRSLSVDAAGAGAIPWAVHASVPAAGRSTLQVTLGTSGSTPAGGAELALTTSPTTSLVARWHPPGAAAPTSVRLWPDPDAAAGLALLAHLVPAELGRRGLEYLRRLDEDVRPVADAALDAIGLLATGVAGDGLRPVRLPLALVTDPVGWFRHAGALGGSAGLDPARVIGFLDALKPVLGVNGGPGRWEVATGVTIVATDSTGRTRLGLQIASSALTPIPPADATVEVTLDAGLVLAPDGPPIVQADLALGLPGATTPGTQALHAALDTSTGIAVFVRPGTGADIPLYPNPPGLGSIASAATHALPFVLNALADETGNDLPGKAGAVVRAVGDAMALRTGNPLSFHDAELQAWAADPGGRLAARLPTLAVSVLQALRDAIGPALPTGVVIAVSGTELQVSTPSVVVGLTANPFAVRLLATPGGLPGVESARVEAVVDGSGLQVLDVTVGPAHLDVEGATLRPYARISAGSAPAAGRRVEIGLGLTDDGARRFAVRWNLGGALDLVALDGTTVSTDPAAVAGAVVEAVVDLTGGIVVGLDTVQELLGHSCGASTIGAVLEGVLVHDDAGTFRLLPAVFDLTAVLARLQQLALNLCRVAKPKLDLAELSLALVESPPGTLGVELIPHARYALGGDDVTIALEFDSSWIGKDPVPDPGLLLRVLHVGAAPGDFSFTPGIEIDGVGIRVARASGPLLELSSLTIASVAVHAYGEVGVGTGVGGGIQLQLSDLAVGTAGATGGGNGVAQGVMKDAGTGPTKLAPRFSPSVSVQKVPTGPDVLVGLRAGDPPGPWWLAIQKGFGPVYIEQVGFDARVEQRHLQSISLLLDGRVSIFGLTAAVDDLSLTFIVASERSFFDPTRWDVDLAGFAISSDLGGLTLVGGLRKFTEPGPPNQPVTIQYIGMLLARFGTYGLSVFGGYGTGRAADGSEFASFFAFGAVNGPIGGPPAFFLTGIGGGLGINRDLVFPTDLSRFGSFPFIAALDPGYTPPSDPMAVLQQYKDTFPIEQGQFWFAAGISFNSFALVDGVAVVAISVGDGFELALLGLARMALPRPQFALVSIELGLICRFSTKEGVLWIQAQLTDNSWLLFPEIRLTGGFAFVSWFKGPNRGQFVLTMGGFHPDFHREGYPTVPRLGFAVDLGFISIKGENYFALTSEAVMAGGRLEGSAELGPAWAHVVFGADGIIFFDPFWLDARVYCRISAGITIDLWFATITISISIGAQIHVQGPKFHGEVEFDIGPVSLTLAFGDDGSEPHPIDFATFVRKYLEEAAGGAARALSSITGRGTLTPRPGPGGPKDVSGPDGTSDHPWVVVSEFQFSVTTTIPVVTIRVDAVPAARNNPSQALGVAPMNQGSMEPGLRLRLIDAANHDHLPDLLNEPGQPRITLSLRTTGTFPVAVWGLPQNKDAKKVPQGDVIAATDGLAVDLHAKVLPGLPPVAYYRVEINTRRRPLPFVRPQVRSGLMAAASALAALVPDEPPLELAQHVLPKAGNSVTAMAALGRDRAAPPRLGSLTEGLADDGAPLGDRPPGTPPVPTQVDHRVLAPVAVALLTSALAQPERVAARTTVSDNPAAPRTAAPTLTDTEAAHDVAVPAVLRRVPLTGTTFQTAGGVTIAPTTTAPLTRASRGPVTALAGRGAQLDGQLRLTAVTGSLTGSRANQVRAARDVVGNALAAVLAGEVAVLALPNARRDAADGDRPTMDVVGDARVVQLGHGGHVLADELHPQQVTVVKGAERIVVVGLGDREGDSTGDRLAGWHSGQQLALVGWNVALGARCSLRTEGSTTRAQRQRTGAGWTRGAELVRGTTTVTTRFVDRPGALAVILDQPVGSEAGQGLAMTLAGAERMAAADGTPVPPSVITGAVRSVVVYPIVPGDPASGAGPVTVTVASEDGWHLVGVLAGPDVATVVATVAARGADDAVRPMTSGTGAVRLTWNGDVPERGRARTPPARPAVMRTSRTPRRPRRA